MKRIKLNVNIWRQSSNKDPGKFVKYTLNDLNSHMSFLEMLDVLNEKLIEYKKIHIEARCSVIMKSTYRPYKVLS